jgi:hypothetical protein
MAKAKTKKPAKTDAKPTPTSDKPAETKKGKAKQLRLEGTGRLDSNPEVDKAAASYLESRDAMKEHKDAMKTRKSALLALVKKLEPQEYIYEDDDGEKFRVKYKQATDEDVTVTKIKDDEDDDGGSDE